MTPRRCSRCGRPRDEEGGSPEAPWASIHGEDVCPDCQSPEEQRDVRLRIVAAIEAEIERRRRENVPPDEIESALVAHALSLREQLQARDVAQTPARPRLRVAMTSAFLTGHPLAVRIASYADLQASLADRLRGPGWRVRRLNGDAGTYESGGGFAESLPLVIARREGPELLSDLRFRLDDPAALERGFDVEPNAIGIDIYDLGVAVMTAWFDVRAPDDWDLAALARALKRVAWLRPELDGPSPVARALQQIAHDTADEFGSAA